MRRLSYFFFCGIILLNIMVGHAYSAESILFLDINNNPLEIAVARKAAIQKGQKLIIYPTGKKEVTEEGLKSIIDNNKFSSMTISGHSGGMSFHGEKGTLDLKFLADTLKNSPSKDSMQSLYLLGCNAGNKSKILFWKESLSNLKFIAGFDGIAPLGHNQLGLNLYADALKKENTILYSQTVSKFKSSMESLQNVKSFPFSLYAKCGDTGGEYLYRPKAVDTAKFAEFNLEECVSNKTKFTKELLPEIEEYMSGKKEATALNPSSGRLREIYVFARQNEHCFTEFDTSVPDGDALLHLRFMKDFNVNFAKYYKNDFEKLKTEVDKLLKDTSNYKVQKNEKLKDAQMLLEKISTDNAAYEKTFGPMKEFYRNQIEMDKANPFYGRCLSPVESNSISSFGLVFNNCSDYGKIISEHGYIKRKLEALEEKSIFLGGLTKNLNAQKGQDLTSASKMSQLKSMSDTLEKLDKNPAQLTRKELIDLKNNFESVSEKVSLGNFRKVEKFLELYRKIDSSAYPFSWHEPAGKEGIEAPKQSYAISGASSVSIRVPLELKVIESEIEHMYFLREEMN